LGANITLPVGINLPLLLANESWAVTGATGLNSEFSNHSTVTSLAGVATNSSIMRGSVAGAITPSTLLMPIYRHLTFSPALSQQQVGVVTELSLGLQPDVWEVNATGSLTFLGLVISNLPEGPQSLWPRSMMLYSIFSVKLSPGAPLTALINCTIVLTTDFYLYFAYWIAQAVRTATEAVASANVS
jgi:hypothetical protein